MVGGLDGFPVTLIRFLPELDAAGTLPPGDYGPTRAEFESVFVNNSQRRAAVYSGWNRHRDALLTAGQPPASRQLLDGSFTTSKTSPNDLDLAVEVPLSYDALKNVPGEAPLLRLLSGPETKQEFSCDAYPIFCLPEDDPHHEMVTRAAIRYWTKWFATTRDGRPKGRVWATVGGLP